MHPMTLSGVRDGCILGWGIMQHFHIMVCIFVASFCFLLYIIFLFLVKILGLKEHFQVFVSSEKTNNKIYSTGHLVLDTPLPLKSSINCRISSIKPVAVSQSERTQFVVKGLNLFRPSTRHTTSLSHCFVNFYV